VLVVAVAAARSGRCCSPPSTPSASTAPSSSARRCRSARPRPSAAGHSFDEELDTTRAGRSTTATTGSRLPRLPRVLLRADVHRAALDQADRGLRRLGLETTPETLDRDDQTRRSAWAARETIETLPPACAARCSSSTATRTDHRRTTAARALAERPAASSSRSRARATARTRATRCKVNLLLRDFAERAAGAAAARGVARARARRKRALFVSSPIGLGHARRDVAIADELRRCTPTSRSTGSPSTRSRRVLEARGERDPPGERATSPTSRRTSSRESASTTCTLPGAGGGWTRSCRELHGLPRRRAREPTTSGSATRRGSSTTSCTRTPSSRRAPYAWLTDFVGWLPMPDGGEREAFLTADYNAEMIEHVARFPRVRDRAIFVGDPDDVVPDVRPGPAGDPRLDRASTSTSPATSPASTRRARRPRALRASSATARTSGLHRHGRRLGRRRRPAAARDRRVPGGEARVPGLRMIVVAGPRIDPASLPQPRRASRCAATSTTSTATSPPATSRSCRAG
jgi:hypothetical protein